MRITDEQAMEIVRQLEAEEMEYFNMPASQIEKDNLKFEIDGMRLPQELKDKYFALTDDAEHAYVLYEIKRVAQENEADAIDGGAPYSQTDIKRKLRRICGR